MQKWQYATLWVSGNVGEFKVIFVNDKKVAETPAFGKVKGASLHEYLNQLGQEGWEAIGTSIGGTGGERLSIGPFIVILKRALV